MPSSVTPLSSYYYTCCSPVSVTARDITVSLSADSILVVASPLVEISNNIDAAAAISSEKRIEYIIPLTVQESQPLRPIVLKWCRQHNIPHEYHALVLAQVFTALEKERRRIADSDFEASYNDNKSSCQAQLVQAYQDHTMKYTTKALEPPFHTAYLHLISCSIPSLFDSLLQLEWDYAKAMLDIWGLREKELNEIKSKHERERTTRRNSIHLAERQREELELSQATWDSQLEDLSKAQRREYQDFIVALYQEVQRLESGVMDDAGGMKEKPKDEAKQQDTQQEQHQSAKIADRLIVQAVEKVKTGLTREPSKEILSLSRSASRELLNDVGDEDEERVTEEEKPKDKGKEKLKEMNVSIDVTAPTQSQQLQVPELSIPPAYQRQVSELAEMGFTKEQSYIALELSQKNSERAIHLLLEDPAKVDNAIQTRLKLQQQTQCSQQNLLAVAPVSGSVSSIIPELGSTRSLAGAKSSSAVSLIDSPVQSGSPQSTRTAKPSSGLTKKLNPKAFLSNLDVNKKLPTPQQQALSQPASSSTRWRPSTSTSFASSSTSSPSTLQQQQQQQPTFEGTLKKIGSFFNKLAELDISSDSFSSSPSASSASGNTPKSPLSPLSPFPQTPDTDPVFTETFTVYLGTQIRRMYALRLCVSDFEIPFMPLKSSSLLLPSVMASWAQTVSELYGNGLRGVVLMVPLSSVKEGRYWQLSGSGNGGINTLFFNRCRQTTEFHFGDVEEQLRNGMQVLKESGHEIREGDFLITRHSNLAFVHVAFHLVFDDGGGSVENADVGFTALSELTPRSQLLQGFKNVLKTSDHFDITHLTFSVFLGSDAITSSPIQPDGPLLRRAETVLKTLKSALVERERGQKHSSSYGGGVAMGGRWIDLVLNRFWIPSGGSGGGGSSGGIIGQRRNSQQQQHQTLVKNWHNVLKQSAMRENLVGHSDSATTGATRFAGAGPVRGLFEAVRDRVGEVFRTT